MKIIRCNIRYNLSLTLLVVLILFISTSVLGQNNIQSNKLPVEWEQWSPTKGMFHLYLNNDNNSIDTLPQIDILSERSSWPFGMQFIHDTLYLNIVPPGFAHERTAIDSLPLEFPMVIKAGKERAIYGYSYDRGKVVIDTSLLPASFINLMPIDTLASDIIYFQLPSSGNHAKTIRKVVKYLESENIAKLIQLEPGFYQGIWRYVSKTTIQRLKLNVTDSKTDSKGILIVFKLNDVSARLKVDIIIDKIMKEEL